MQGDMRFPGRMTRRSMSGRHAHEAQGKRVHPPQPSKVFAAHLFAALAKLDEVHSVAPDLKDWDWLRVDEAFAELGVVTSSTALEPTTRTEVTFSRRRSGAQKKKRGVGG